ncbi:FRG domain-containing protein [Undibacterium macrobrachii]|uniref:FRG domain-containing protein n=1 Tax=Undibacterium macrobrachii TaxID=1119058 RepID=A0ABQ2XK25_9BURK|nr:FRG domain-containing protein [Undibacterium macrobrachii]GGX21175.1 hypothetical protein GCM10011282_29160 [Undibacterium macrobrachii]
MNNLYHGQYIGIFRYSGTLFTLMLNADTDRPGVGIGYINTAENESFIYECFEVFEVNKVINGKAKRSIPLEVLHGIKNKTEIQDNSIYEFKLDRSTDRHSLTASDQNPENIEFIDCLSESAEHEATSLDSWQDYKDFVSNMYSRDRAAVFRGVSRKSFKLRTSFHRLGRTNLERYRHEDLPVFGDLAETIGGVNVGNENGAMWAYAQHHGFPTPLLDWSESAYVAAYFALSDRLNSIEDEEPARIYILSGSYVLEHSPQFLNLSETAPRINIFKPKSKGNQRLIFQRGLFLISNVIDIESYLMKVSTNKQQGVSPLTIVDIPASEARRAIADLAFMGTHAMSLFPGLDGATKFAMNKQFFKP